MTGTFSIRLGGQELAFDFSCPDEHLFSPHGLDKGTQAMLELCEILPHDKVLDLGCGWGPVGLAAARMTAPENVVMADADPRAVECAEKNAGLNHIYGITFVTANGVSDEMDRDFTLIMSNPPYHTDFSVAKGFIEHGFAHLLVGGRMALVVKRLKWYENKMKAVFGGVRVCEKYGYYVLMSEKRTARPPAKKKKQVKRKQLKRISGNQ